MQSAIALISATQRGANATSSVRLAICRFLESGIRIGALRFAGDQRYEKWAAHRMEA